MNEQRTPENDTQADTDTSDDAVIGRAFRGSMVVIVLAALVAGGIVFWQMRTKEEEPTQQIPISLPQRRETADVEIPKISFTDITAQAGIDFVHENGAAGQKLLPETMGGGCAFFDYDNDGDQDILLVNSRRWPWDERPDKAPATLALYQNDGSGRFDNVTSETGLDVSLYGMGVAIGDYDNDGWTDVFVSALGPNRLFRNTGGRFVDVSSKAGIGGEENEWSTSCGWFDYDNDGDLDLMVCNYLRWSKELDVSLNFRLIGGGRGYGRPQAFDGTFPYLYRNEGDGTFADVSAAAGVQIRNPATKVRMAKSLGLAFADFDSDGLLDVLVANDTVQNFLFHNRGDGTFEETGTTAGVAFDSEGKVRGAMGIDISHFRNNKTFGIAIGNFTDEMTALYVSQPTGAEAQMPSFSDESVSNGLGPVTLLELTFGVFFFDCDLDGRLDLFTANGHLEEDINLVQASQHYQQSPHLLWNCGPEHKTEFISVTAERSSHDLVKPMVGRGSAFADIDGDGDLDILIAATGEAPRLLRNDQSLGNHWLRLKLVGSVSNRDAIGAEIAVHVGGAVLRQQVMPTRGYLSQSELPVTFGLGKAQRVDHVLVRWPSGKTTRLNNPPIDGVSTLREPAD